MSIQQFLFTKGIKYRIPKGWHTTALTFQSILSRLLSTKLVYVPKGKCLRLRVIYYISFQVNEETARHFTSDHWNKAFGIIEGFLPDPRRRSWRGGFRILDVQSGSPVLETCRYNEIDRHIECANIESHFFNMDNGTYEARVVQYLYPDVGSGYSLIKKTFPYYGGAGKERTAPTEIQVQCLDFYLDTVLS